MYSYKIITYSLLLCVVAQTDGRRCFICGNGSDEPFKVTSDVPKEVRGNHQSQNHPGAITTATEKRWDVATDPNHNSGITSNASYRSGSNFMFRTCQEFDRRRITNAEEFTLECPSNYEGCITQVEGNNVTRTCEILGLNDCQTANGITYCYCTDDLCNGVPTGSLPRKNKETRNKSHRGSERKHVRFADQGTMDDEDLAESSGMAVQQSSSEGRNRKNQQKASNDKTSIIDDGTSTDFPDEAKNSSTFSQSKSNPAKWMISLVFLSSLISFVCLELVN